MIIEPAMASSNKTASSGKTAPRAGRKPKRREAPRPKADGAPALPDDAAELAKLIRLDAGLGFMTRVLNARSNDLFMQLTAQPDITPRQFGVLLSLHQKGALTLTKLASEIRVDRSTLSEMMRRMEKRRLVIRRDNDDDGRSARVSLAPQGQAVLLDMVKGAARLQDALLAPLTMDERRAFLRAMRKITAPAPAEPSR